MKKLMITQKKMGKTVGKIVHFRWSLLEKVSVFKDFFKFILDKILVCSIRKNHEYRRLSVSRSGRPSSSSSMEDNGDADISRTELTSSSYEYDSDSDVVSLKISLLGDSQIGKTSFVMKYVGDEEEKMALQMRGLNMMDKTLSVKGAKIAVKIWDVGGDLRSLDQVPIACKDAVAVLFMFDLTNRTSLNSVIDWYGKARKWNQTAIPILIGTKFDDFVQLPPNIQWTVITQARTYARAMKASLFFSSATHNINVNKIFKFIMAKLLNLPSTVERNLTIGEPIIDY